MAYRLFFPTDLHKRDTDFTSITGYTQATDMVQYDMIKFIQDQSITHMIQTGDWYDKGYRNINRTHSDRNLDEHFKRVLDGHFYMCIGNHFFLERDNNPEMYLIQPHPMHVPAKRISAFEPVIRTPNKIRVGPVQISLFHFDKENKLYIAQRDPDATYHIGVYHDDAVVPSSVRQKAGFFGETSSVYMAQILENIDLAIVGHIHTPIGVEQIMVNNRRVPMIIPGSLAITKNSAYELHTEVKLPVVNISDEGEVSCQLYRFSLHADMLKFYDKREAKSAKNNEGIPIAHIDPPKATNLREFLAAKGHNERRLSLVQRVNEATVDPLSGLNILGVYEQGGSKK